MNRLLKRMVAWGQRKIEEDTISEEEAERIWREFEKFAEENKVK